MALSESEERLLKAIDDSDDKISAFAEKVYNNPELGYKEYKTAAAVKEEFDSLGIKYCDGGAVTSVKGSIGSGDFRLCIIGEMDAVKNSEHPGADIKTGAAHACGHHGQLAAMMGAAYGLINSRILPELDGVIDFFAVPAEEYIDLDYRRELRKAGKIKCLSGKQQLLCEGAFDNTDAAIMVHAQPDMPKAGICLHGKNLGFVEKQITFRGVASHASEPYNGVNALNAAALAILGIHANREHFREEDKIRIHPIITKGGDAVNIVPAEVCMDSYVRGASLEAIKNASADTDRALNGGAMMVGASAEIITSPGYLPLKQDFDLGELVRAAAEEILPADRIFEGIDVVGSTDIGDLSHLIPCVQPTVGGYCGTLHSNELHAAAAYDAYIVPAKILALTAVRLLKNNAAEGRKIKQSFKPSMNKKEYIDYLENI